MRLPVKTPFSPRATVALAVCAVLVTGESGTADNLPAPTIENVQHLFYNAQYQESAALATTVPAADLESTLAIADVRSSALLFQVKRLLAQGSPKGNASQRVARCAD